MTSGVEATTAAVVEKKGAGGGQFGDTTLTKVFVGGLAWETQREAMRSHFEQFGEILEAVIISDKITGRSKGYGFVTFKDPEAARKACEDATPVINGRRANCNLASLGARRAPRAPTPQPPPAAINVIGGGGVVGNGGIRNTASPVPLTGNGGGAVQWYYPAAAAAAAAAGGGGGGGAPTPPHYQQHQTLPFHPYGRYSPTYYTTDMTYNQKVGYCGSYVNGQYSQIYPTQAGMMTPNAVVPMYPYFHFHQSQTMGLPAAQLFPPTTTAPLTTMPGFISKPAAAMAPNAGLAVQQKVTVREASGCA